MNPNSQQELQQKASRWYGSGQGWLLYLAAVFLTSISTTIPIAVWISPFLILLFIERMPRLTFGLSIVTIVLSLGQSAQTANNQARKY